jgi:hypothetical protein
MLASSNVSIQTLGQHCLKAERADLNVRRNYLVLFDSFHNESVKMDVSIGVSLVDRQKESVLHERLNNVHATIPGAKMPKETEKNLRMQKFFAQKQEARHLQVEEGGIEEDPQLIIQQSRAQKQIQ